MHQGRWGWSIGEVGGSTRLSDKHTSRTLQREEDLLSKPSPRAWRPSTLRETLSASSVGSPAPSRASLQASACWGSCHLLLILPPPVSILSTFDYLPTSEVGPQGKGQACGPFLIWPAPPFPCCLPAIPRSYWFWPGPPNGLVQFYLLAFAYAVNIPGETFSQILPPNEDSPDQVPPSL